jgi:hypothetical protein
MAAKSVALRADETPAERHERMRPALEARAHALLARALDKLAAGQRLTRAEKRRIAASLAPKGRS